MISIQDLLKKLITFQSITPNDAGCQDYLIEQLEQLGFSCQRMNQPPVSNFFARRGHVYPLLVFAGHTDVVPIGNRANWHTDPFVLHEKDGLLYGRGTADMKGSLACMIIAATRFLQDYPDFPGSLGFLITSGEEGDDFHLGTPYVMQQLHQQGIHPDYCVLGEPSSTQHLGDVIKIGRRGSLSASVHLEGKQGHVAYPHLAENPIHRVSPALLELTQTLWDQGNAHFPPTTLQITHIQAGGQAGNVIPGELTLHFNIRYSTEHTDNNLKQIVEQCFLRHKLFPTIHWRLNGEPFLTSSGRLLTCSIQAIQHVTNRTPELSTSGGTSDGRFIAPYRVEVIELGPVNATIHQANECVALSDLEQLSRVYHELIIKILID